MRQNWNENAATASNVSAISRELQPISAKSRGDILQNAEWFAIMSLELWKNKVSAHLRVLFLKADEKRRYSDRTLHAWGAGENELPSRALVFLLRSDDGGRILDWVMEDCDAAWWSRYLRAERIYNALAAELRE